MTPLSHLRSERFAPWIAALLLAVMLVRGLIPVGVMPDAEAAARGGFPLVICTGLGERTILVDADGNPVNGGAGLTAESPCLFALVLGTLVPLLAAILMALVVWSAAAPWVARRFPAFRPAGPPGPLSARGPPAAMPIPT